MFVSNNMTHMHVDLNLLTALDALLEEGSVAGAADRMHLTQPAMSRALARIRRTMDDQILVRSGHTMTPTPRAVALRAQVHTLVQQAQAVLAPEREPDIATVERTFTLMAHDAIITAIGPHLLESVIAQAPGIRLRMIAEPLSDSNDLRQGRVDLTIGADTTTQTDIAQHTATTDHLVAAVRQHHPITNLTIHGYTAAQHVTVSRRGRIHDRIDDVLATGGHQRHVAATVPTTAAALHIVANSDLITAVPQHICATALASHGLRTLPLPFDLTPVPIVIAWHRRYDRDHTHTWLRRQVNNAVAAHVTPKSSSPL